MKYRKMAHGRDISAEFIKAWLDDLKGKVTLRMEHAGSLRRCVQWLALMEGHLDTKQDIFNSRDLKQANREREAGYAITPQAANLAAKFGVNIQALVPADGKKIRKADVEAIWIDSEAPASLEAPELEVPQEPQYFTHQDAMDVLKAEMKESEHDPEPVRG